LTPWSRVVLDELKFPKLFNRFPIYYAPKCSLPWSQQPATVPYPYPNEWSTHPLIGFLKDQFNIVLPCTDVSSQRSRSFMSFDQTLCAFSLCNVRANCPTFLTLLHFITVIIFGINKLWTSQFRSIHLQGLSKISGVVGYVFSSCLYILITSQTIDFYLQ